jgi:opacity protein-like surface antigen
MKNICAALIGLGCLMASQSAWAQFGYGPEPMETNSYIDQQVSPQTIRQSSGFLTVRDGFFLQLEGTTFALGDLEASTGDSAAFLSADTAYGFMGTIGSIGRRGLGFELASGYYKADYTGDYDAFGAVSGDLSAKLTVIPVFVNVRFQLGLTESLGIEIGAGAGGAYASATATAESDLGDFSASESAWETGFQGMLGVSYALGNHADLLLHYRRMMFSASELSANSFGLGLRLRF